MGAISFNETWEGSSPNDAWNKAIAEANYRKGYESYNGSINTCGLGREKLSFEKYTEANVRKAYDFIDKNDNGEKYIAHYVNLGLVGYEVVTVEKVVVKHGTPKSVYIVYDNVRGLKALKGFSEKLDADDWAFKYALSNPTSMLVVRREKKYSNGENDDLYRYKTKVEHRSTKIKGKKNQKVRPLYKFMFYGWASC